MKLWKVISKMGNVGTKMYIFRELVVVENPNVRCIYVHIVGPRDLGSNKIFHGIQFHEHF